MKKYVEFRAWIGVVVDAETRDEAIEKAEIRCNESIVIADDIQIMDAEPFYIRNGGFVYPDFNDSDIEEEWFD